VGCRSGLGTRSVVAGALALAAGRVTRATVAVIVAGPLVHERVREPGLPVLAILRVVMLTILGARPPSLGKWIGVPRMTLVRITICGLVHRLRGIAAMD